jgi:membrane protease YdiL (CAAX protease family)
MSSPGDRPTLNLGGLRLPLRETVVVLVCTFVLLIDYYHLLGLTADPTLSRGIQRVALFLGVPVITLLLLGERPSAYGLRLGNWRIGVPLMIGAMLLATPPILVVSGLPDFIGYYGGKGPSLVPELIGHGIDVAAAEFLFRGFLMWTLIGIAGPVGVVLATLPFVFSHLGKPELETLTTFFGGLVFGWMAWRTRSVVYGGLLHVYLISLIVLAATR